ncbi:MAG: hypothetical protein WDM91_16685 [Rhizomicrobium sp.]
MAKLLDKAFAPVTKLPSDSQHETTRAMLKLPADSEPEQIDPAHLPTVHEGLAQAKAGQYASVADVEAAFRRFNS